MAICKRNMDEISLTQSKSLKNKFKIHAIKIYNDHKIKGRLCV